MRATLNLPPVEHPKPLSAVKLPEVVNRPAAPAIEAPPLLPPVVPLSPVTPLPKLPAVEKQGGRESYVRRDTPSTRPPPAKPWSAGDHDTEGTDVTPLPASGSTTP